MLSQPQNCSLRDRFLPVLPVLARSPLLFPLATLLAVHAGFGLHPASWGLALLPALITLLQGRWSLSTLCLLVGAIALIQSLSLRDHSEQARAKLRGAPEMRLRGTIVRASPYSAFLEWEGLAPIKIELRHRRPDQLGELGDRVEVIAIPYESMPSRLPGSFDRQAWLDRNAVVHSVQVESLRLLDRPLSWAALRGEAARWRENLVQRLIPTDKAHDPRRQVLASLVLGEKRQAEHATLELFQWSGGLHAFAVSGLHVGLVAGFLWFILRFLLLPPRLSCIIVLLGTAAYVLLTGMAVSSLRAYLMMSLFLLGFLLRRQQSPLNLLSAAALITLLIDPLQWQQAGFLLSFIVYGAILAAMALLQHSDPWLGPDRYLPYAFYTRREHRMTLLDKLVRGNIIISAAAWLSSLPLMMLLFGTWNALGIITNVLIAPLLPLVMASGLMLLLLAPVPWLAVLIDWIALQASGILLTIVTYCATLPGAYLPTKAPAQDDSYLIMDLGYGKSACQLGNGGLLILQGNEMDARWRIRPALFSSGYQPSLALYLATTRKQQEDAAQQLAPLRALWPRLQFITPPATQARHFRTRQDTTLRWSLYPSPLRAYSSKSQDDNSPLIHWQSAKQRLLYLGNASAATLAYWRERGTDLHADTIILGYNKTQPILDEQWLLDLGAARVILLPSFPRSMDALFSPALSIQRVAERGALEAQLNHRVKPTDNNEHHPDNNPITEKKLDHRGDEIINNTQNDE